MYKKMLKSVIVCVSVIFFTLILGYIAYCGAISVINRPAKSNEAQAAYTETIPETVETVTPTEKAETYLAKLNEDKIEIYRQTADGDEFICDFRVYPGGIPDDDLAMLKRGIIFDTEEELAAFEEDFGS